MKLEINLIKRDMDARQILLSKQSVIEEIEEEIKKYMETVKREI